MAGPWVLVGGALAGACIAGALRRWSAISALWAAAVSLALATLSWRTVRLPGFAVEMAQPAYLWGTSLALSSLIQALLGLVFTAVTFSVLGTLGRSPDRDIPTLSLAASGLWAAALMSQDLMVTALILAVIAAPVAVLLRPTKPGHPGAAVRYLLITALAAMALLLVPAFINQAPLNPQDPTPQLIAGALLGLGWALLTGLMPFHTWLLLTGSEARPVPASLVLGTAPLLSMGLGLTWLERYPWLLTVAPRLPDWLVWIGLATAAASGVLAAVTPDLGRLWGYASLIDLSALVMALGVALASGTQGAWMVLGGGMAARVVSHAAIGWALIESRGRFRTRPWAAGLLALGFLSLIGYPPALGFFARQPLYQVQTGPGVAFLFLAGTGVIVGLIRMLIATTPSQRLSSGEADEIRRLPLLTVVGLALLLIPGLVWRMAGPLVAALLRQGVRGA